MCTTSIPTRPIVTDGVPLSMVTACIRNSMLCGGHNRHRLRNPQVVSEQANTTQTCNKAQALERKGPQRLQGAQSLRVDGTLVVGVSSKCTTTHQRSLGCWFTRQRSTGPRQPEGERAVLDHLSTSR